MVFNEDGIAFTAANSRQENECGKKCGNAVVVGETRFSQAGRECTEVRDKEIRDDRAESELNERAEALILTATEGF